jgi:biopolymer transport protein ExbB
MLSKLFLGLSLAGAEWVLYVLILLSIFSIALIIERIFFYKKATNGLQRMRESIRKSVASGDLSSAKKSAETKMSLKENDLESAMAVALLNSSGTSIEILNEIANDHVVAARIFWDKNLAILATIGSNAPFIGLFGTVLGIIQAFHDLSSQAASGVQGVTAGISEALVATAVGILVAIPATIAYNMFTRKTKSAAQEAESLKSFLIGKIAK